MPSVRSRAVVGGVVTQHNPWTQRNRHLGSGGTDLATYLSTSFQPPLPSFYFSSFISSFIHVFHRSLPPSPSFLIHRPVVPFSYISLAPAVKKHRHPLAPTVLILGFIRSQRRKLSVFGLDQ